MQDCYWLNDVRQLRQGTVRRADTVLHALPRSVVGYPPEPSDKIHADRRHRVEINREDDCYHRSKHGAEYTVFRI